MGEHKNCSEVGQVLALSALVAVLGWWFFDSMWFFLAIPALAILFWSSEDHQDKPRLRRCPWCGFETCDPAVHNCPQHKRPLTHAGL